MTCLLLNTAPDLSDPRIAVLDNRARAASAMCDTPTRLGWVVTEGRDLLRRPDFAPEIARDAHLGNGDLVRIFKAVDPTATVKRFANRAAGAKRIARLLLGRFIINEESKAMEENTMSESEQQAREGGYHPSDEDSIDAANTFVPTVGMRVTILANEVMGYLEEHGVVSEDSGDGTFTVTADPAYRGDAGDDGERLVELKDLAPDPVGEMRQRAKAVSAKDAKAADREAKRRGREAEAAQKKADREAKRAAKSAPKPKVGRSSKLVDSAVIRLVSDKNPKRAGSKAYGYWESLRNGMTVKEAMDAGVPRGDILWNRDKNFIRIDA
jgi:hypothetical protein